MIRVIATIKVKPGTRQTFLEYFNANVPEVLKEPGCLEYVPTIDVDADLELQERDPDSVVVIEAWESVEALQVHLATTHMLAFGEKVKEIVDSISLRLLEPASA